MRLRPDLERNSCEYAYICAHRNKVWLCFNNLPFGSETVLHWGKISGLPICVVIVLVTGNCNNEQRDKIFCII